MNDPTPEVKVPWNTLHLFAHLFEGPFIMFVGIPYRNIPHEVRVSSNLKSEEIKFFVLGLSWLLGPEWGFSSFIKSDI